MNSNTIIEKIQKDSYAVVENALTAEAVAEIKDALAPYLKGELMGRNDFEGFHSERVYALLTKTPGLAHIIEHPLTMGVVDEFLQPGYLLSAAIAINVHPGETPQDFHIDDGGNAEVLKRPRPMVGVSTIWALDDFTDDNGATEIIPGSHLWGEDGTPREEEAVRITMPAGSVVIFAGNTFHRGGANNSGATRLGITAQYCQPWLRQIEQMVLAVPPEAARQYSPRIQEMLGYGIVNPGFMGYVDGMHPARLLDDGYVGHRQRGVDFQVPKQKPIY